MDDQVVIDALKHEAFPIKTGENYDALLAEIAQASIVLLGESTHGSEEFYAARSDITRRLIEEKGFDAIAIEADWPDALQVNRYVKGGAGIEAKSAEEALRAFQRFPLWMWRNTAVVELIDWLRRFNADAPPADRQIGLFGLDLYSLRKSMDAVVAYLAQVDPEAARQARARYSCFDHMAEDPQRYGYAASFGMKKDCEQEVMRQLQAMAVDAEKFIARDGPAAADELFYAEQNARVAQNAEAYYRAMFSGRDESWNLRDTHMADTLDALRRHLSAQRGRPAKIVVWAHNSHIGDARATEMGDHGQLNLGQLVRQRYQPGETFLLGFTTHAGTVTAASEWDSPAELKQIRPSRPDSYEKLFHNTGLGNFLLPMRGRKTVSKLLSPRRLERAIGVIYLPDSERMSHYFHADITSQFDAVIHFDQSFALIPLDRTMHWRHDEVPDTFPSGI